MSKYHYLALCTDLFLFLASISQVDTNRLYTIYHLRSLVESGI
jgi:hypothetical protein